MSKTDMHGESAVRCAHLPGNARGGRSDEFRLGERLRGDHGGGPSADGLPGVPHTADEIAVIVEQLEDDVVVVEFHADSAILEVMERFDEPALEPTPSEAELWEEVFVELARRASA